MEDSLTAQAARILDCAQALVAVGGYNGFSYADVSAQIGITKASIHHHFPKKADLVLTLVKRYRAAAMEGMAALRRQGPSPRSCLEAYLGWWKGCIGDSTMPICICAMLAAESPVLPADVAEEVRLYFVALASWLEESLTAGAASGEFQLKGSLEAEAQTFMATVHGAMISARASRDPDTFGVVVDTLIERIVSPSSTKSKRAPSHG